MKKIFMAILIVSFAFIIARAASAWPAEGVIYGADIEYSGMSVTKNGVSVKLTNTSGNDVKVSLKLTFYDTKGNSLGYSIFGLREIAAGGYADISNNHLNGKWKPCRDAQRIDFSKMTYEPLY
ncbi:MAG: hypothetical protein LBT23_08445 [Synergistaceae bacterium]|nr:hypothetical protein [Synergistaceae bacterium]